MNQRVQQPPVDDPTKRVFEDKPAIRGKVPLLVGIMGPSGGGKTFSALRLATGIQRVSGGDIFVVDTEARRALHYAGVKPTLDSKPFAFRHVPFAPPFGPLHYLAALEHCMRKGAGVVIVDSMSHEHEGPGGVLELHEREVQRLSRGDAGKAERVKMLAWSKPKSDRRRMINTVLQMPCHFIFCFRAKEKIKIVRGSDPEPRGYMPIAGEEFVYEMATNILLLPNAGGIPTWQSQESGEKQMIKLPLQFRGLFAKAEPLNETHGEQLAIWSEGVRSAAYEELAQAISDAATVEALDALKPRLAEVKSKKTVPPAEFNALISLAEDRKRTILSPPAAAPADTDPAEREFDDSSAGENYDPETGEVYDPPEREPGSDDR